MKTTVETTIPWSDGAIDVDAKRKSAIKGAFFSEFIDMFDIYLPVVVLAPVMFLFQPANLSPSMEAIFASIVFITTLLGRPLGALIFGVISDRVGRRKASIYSVSGFGVITLMIGLLPGYQTIGVASYALLVFLRFVDGIFLGGGYTGAIPLAIEYSRKEQRGLVGGIIMAGFPAAYVSINLVAMVVFALFPLHGASSPYAQWGWRIPFFTGAILAGVLALYYVFEVEESEIWKSEGRKGSDNGASGHAEKTPLSDLLRGKSGKSLIQVLTLMSGFWLTQNIITLFLPGGVLVRTLHLSGLEMSLTLLATYFVLIFSYLGSGLLGQKIGRRRFFMISGPLIATIGSALLYLLSNGHGYSLPTIIGMVCLLAVLVTAPWGVLITYINERFVTDVRATGFGVGFSLSVIIPSFYAFYMNWLDAILPVHASPSVLLSLGGLIAMAGAWMGPETKNVDF